MLRFDAELYLRLIGEEMLLDARPEPGGWSSPLDDAADALVVVGAITAAKARSIDSDYSWHSRCAAATAITTSRCDRDARRGARLER